MRPFLDAFPDIHHHIGPVVAGGDGVAFELEIHGTHTAPLATPQGELPPTGRELHLDACNVWRLTDDGAIASYRLLRPGRVHGGTGPGARRRRLKGFARRCRKQPSGDISLSAGFAGRTSSGGLPRRAARIFCSTLPIW